MADSVSLEVGNEEGSFYGLKIEQGIKYNLVMKTNMVLANVAIDPITVKDVPDGIVYEEASDEDIRKRGYRRMVGLYMIQDGLDAPLHYRNKKDLQSRVGYGFIEGDEVTLYVLGSGTYYTCWYKQSINYFSE